MHQCLMSYPTAYELMYLSVMKILVVPGLNQYVKDAIVRAKQQL